MPARGKADGNESGRCESGERRRAAAHPHLLGGEELGRPRGGGAEVGQGGAQAGDGADEGDEVRRRQAAARVLAQAGEEGVAAALGQVREGGGQGLRGGFRRVRGLSRRCRLCNSKPILRGG